MLRTLLLTFVVAATLVLSGCRDYVANRTLERKLNSRAFSEIVTDSSLLRAALAYGRDVFNRPDCTTCHGIGGVGNPYWCPPLNDDEWIWGGTPDEIFHTIKYGVRQMRTPASRRNPLGVPAPRTRYLIMPRFDSVLTTVQIRDVARLVRAWAEETPHDTAGRGVYDQHCASCHGRDGEGSVPGAPRLVRHRWVQQDNPEHLEEYIAIGGYVTTSRDARVSGTRFDNDVAGMPEWGNAMLGLRDGQIRAVALYLARLADE